MIEFKQAEAVSKTIRAMYGKKLPDWFLGIGIDNDQDEGFAISVRVLTGHADKIKLGKRIDGVKVCVEEREIARPVTNRRPQKQAPKIPPHVQVFLDEIALYLPNMKWESMAPAPEMLEQDKTAKIYTGQTDFGQGHENWIVTAASFSTEPQGFPAGSRGYDAVARKGGIVLHLTRELSLQAFATAEKYCYLVGA